MNLCLNAASAMPAGGRLCLSTGFVYVDEKFSRNHLSVRPGRYVLLRVEDTGSGISEENKVKIFQPFFTTKGAEGGTGLGLSVASGVVTRHGGTIQVSSTPGLGSTFSVYLPAGSGQQTEGIAARSPASRAFASRVPEERVAPSSAKGLGRWAQAPKEGPLTTR